MKSDRQLARLLFLVLLLPLGMAFCSGDRFRYPCQDPANWDKDFCKLPICDVTRTCPEQIFKGQRDPRLGPPPPDNTVLGAPKNNVVTPPPTGVICK
jgi:hypothetical protein